MKKYFFLFALLFISSLGFTQKKTLYVADRRSSCIESATMECLLIKESKKGAWQSYSSSITGFNYEEGYEYQLQVEVEPAPAGTPAKYRLLKVKSKKRTKYDPSEKLADKRWYLYQMYADSHYIKLLDTTTVYMQFYPSERQISGHGVCNTFSGGLIAEGYKISILQMASTKMECTGTILESIIKDMMEEMVTFTVAGNTLTLKNADGGSYLLFKYWQ
ncbi:MAG: DUF4377 domain-containing protein [Chitinophagales bacterium]